MRPGALHEMPSIRVLYKQYAYVLQDYKYLLRHRSLLARGRALLGPQTPEVVARLFGGRWTRPSLAGRRAGKSSTAAPGGRARPRVLACDGVLAPR